MSIRRNTIEFFRNTIHACSALTPWFAYYIGVFNALLFIFFISLFYTIGELKHIRYPHLYSLIDLADRDRSHRFFALGPLSLALGVSLVLYFFPLRIATPAILVLAFGDSISSVVGVRYGKHLLPYGHKTWEGSLSCLFLSTLVLIPHVTALWPAVCTALIASLAESTMIRDLDNILVPTATAIILALLIG